MLYHHILKMKTIHFRFLVTALFATAAIAQSNGSENGIGDPDDGSGNNTVDAGTGMNDTIDQPPEENQSSSDICHQQCDDLALYQQLPCYIACLIENEKLPSP